jgi:hypothetical protein
LCRQYANKKSECGYASFLNGVLFLAKTKMKESVTLSVTEAELVSVTNCTQDIMYIRIAAVSIDLKVKLPMTEEVDNKGANDKMNN